jgi:hypothetical protein
VKRGCNVQVRPHYLDDGCGYSAQEPGRKIQNASDSTTTVRRMFSTIAARYHSQRGENAPERQKTGRESNC